MLQEGKDFHCISIVQAFHVLWCWLATAVLIISCHWVNFIAWDVWNVTNKWQMGISLHWSISSAVRVLRRRNLQQFECSNDWLIKCCNFPFFCRLVMLSLMRQNAMAIIIASGKETALPTWAADGTQLIILQSTCQSSRPSVLSFSWAHASMILLQDGLEIEWIHRQNSNRNASQPGYQNSECTTKFWKFRFLTAHTDSCTCTDDTFSKFMMPNLVPKFLHQWFKQKSKIIATVTVQWHAVPVNIIGLHQWLSSILLRIRIQQPVYTIKYTLSVMQIKIIIKCVANKLVSSKLRIHWVLEKIEQRMESSAGLSELMHALLNRSLPSTFRTYDEFVYIS